MGKIYCKAGDFMVQLQPFSCPPAPLARFVAIAAWPQDYLEKWNSTELHEQLQHAGLPHDIPKEDLSRRSLVRFAACRRSLWNANFVLRMVFKVGSISSRQSRPFAPENWGDWKIAYFWGGCLDDQILKWLPSVLGFLVSGWVGGFFVGVGGWGFVPLDISSFWHLETLRDHPSRYV